MFNVVRGGRIDSQERVWVIDGGSAEIRLFDMEGSFISSIGGRGEGPGEFQAPGLVGTTPGDTVMLWDYRLYRLSLFNEDAGFIRTEVPARGSSMPPRPLAFLPDGFFLTQQLRVASAESVSSGQVLTDTVRLRKSTRDLAESQVLLEAGQMQWIWTGLDQVLMPFSAGVRFAVAGDRLAVLSGTRSEIAIFDLDGNLLGRFGVSWPQRQVSERDREDYRSYVQSLPLDEARKRDRIAQLKHSSIPDRLPSYDLLFGTEEGEIWARRFKVYHSGKAIWDVFSGDGNWLAEAELGENFLLYGVESDWVYGVARDEFDVESVRLYRRLQ